VTGGQQARGHTRTHAADTDETYALTQDDFPAVN
jgi:hypothetical protein